MDRSSLDETNWHHKEFSPLRAVVFGLLGLILLQLVGCALGPGYGAARKEEPPPAVMQGQPVEEPKQLRRHTEQGKETPAEKITPSQKPLPSGDPTLPPEPSKPPATVGGSGG
mgnify:CR=1 FL=1